MKHFALAQKCAYFFVLLSLLSAGYANAAPTKQSTHKESTQSGLVDKIVATVGSEAVLLSELTELPSRLKKDGSIDDTLLLDENLDALKNNKSAQLQYLIREKLVESEIKRLNLSFTNERVDEEMSALAKRGGMDKASLEAYVKRQGYDLDEYKKTLKSRMERKNFFESEIVSKLRITDDDAYNEYKLRNPKFKPNINEYKLAMIFFNNHKGSEDEALKRATLVYNRLEAGESFDSLANKYNEDSGAGAGGVIGSFKTGELNSGMENAITNLDAGEHSKIIRTARGFQILKVLDKKVTVDPAFQKYKEQIKAGLVEKNFRRQLKNWFESKKQDANIKIYE